MSACISHWLKIIDYETKYVLLGCENCKETWTYLAESPSSAEDSAGVTSPLPELNDAPGPGPEPAGEPQKRLEVGAWTYEPNRPVYPFSMRDDSYSHWSIEGVMKYLPQTTSEMAARLEALSSPTPDPEAGGERHHSHAWNHVPNQSWWCSVGGCLDSPPEGIRFPSPASGKEA